MQLYKWIVGAAVGASVVTTAGAQEKGGNFETGAYEVVLDWPRQLHDDYGWGRTSAIFAESPDRVFVFQSGELPRLSNPIGAGELPIRPAAAENNSPDVGFRFNLNPYRGCEHGCVYCASGETPILMAIGGTRKLAELVEGDEIYGTVREGHYRRYAKTRVPVGVI